MAMRRLRTAALLLAAGAEIAIAWPWRTSTLFPAYSAYSPWANSTGGYAFQYTQLAMDFAPSTFFDEFDFFTASDPTHGFVKYIDRNTAQSQGIISTGYNNVYIGVDHTNIAPNGRQSIRLQSKQVFTHGLFILDLSHMPTGCGTWPAFWTLGDNWPNNGEIDILEGINEQVGNSITTHTSDGCSVSGTRQTGQHVSPNCYVNATNQTINQGCQTRDNRYTSYGAGFNYNGGGVYAMEWNSLSIKVWMFPRGQVPADALQGQPVPANWGLPTAVFQGACNIDQHFIAHRIIFDVTFCGDWAGSAWNSSTCPSRAPTCNSYVANNPSAFSEAYWLINSLKVWSS